MFIHNGLNHQWARPHAQRYVGTHDRTYYVYQGSASSNADVCVRYYDHDTDTLSAEVVLETYPGTDAHGCPSILIPKIGDYAGHVFVFYGYNAAAGKVRRSTNPEDISAFGTSVEFDPNITYTNPRQVANGDIWVFYRWTNTAYPDNNYPDRPLAYRVSSDGGATWSARTILVQPTPTPCGFCYALITNVGDTIHVAWMHYSAARATGAFPTGPYHIYTTDKTTWRASDGTPITLPATNATAGVAYALPGTHEVFLTDLKLGGASPHVQFQMFVKDGPQGGAYKVHYAGGWQTDYEDAGAVGLTYPIMDPRNLSRTAYSADAITPALLDTSTGDIVGHLNPDTVRGIVWWDADDPDGGIVSQVVSYPTPGDYNTWVATSRRAVASYLGPYDVDVTLTPLIATTRRRQRIALGGV